MGNKDYIKGNLHIDQTMYSCFTPYLCPRKTIAIASLAIKNAKDMYDKKTINTT